MKIFAIDPGNIESAFVVWDGENILRFGKVENHLLQEEYTGIDIVVIEQIASMGMAVGEDVFETVFWSGRFAEQAVERGLPFKRIKRVSVKMHICGNTRAKDSNIATSIVDRFDPERRFGKYGKGTKKEPGMFFGFFKDVWQAFALALTYYDTMDKQKDAE